MTNANETRETKMATSPLTYQDGETINSMVRAINPCARTRWEHQEPREDNRVMVIVTNSRAGSSEIRYLASVPTAAEVASMLSDMWAGLVKKEKSLRAAAAAYRANEH